MTKSLILLILILMSATFGLAQNTKKINIYSRVGTVDSKGQDSICLQTKNASLVKNTPISIIIRLDKKPQKILLATVKKKLKER